MFVNLFSHLPKKHRRNVPADDHEGDTLSNNPPVRYTNFALLETIPENGCLELKSLESPPRKGELKKLFRATKSGDASTLLNYLLRGGNPDVRNYSHQSLLHVACFKGHIEIVKELLRFSSDPFAVDSYQRTPLHYACLGGQSHVILELLKTVTTDVGQDIYGCSLLHLAVASGCLKTLTYVAVLQSKKSINLTDEKCRTCLYMAVLANLPEMVDFLLSMGANKSIGDQMGWTPIHEACAQGYLDIVKLLCNEKICMAIKDKHLRTPLHVACEKGEFDVVKFLCMHGASVHDKAEYGCTILHIACWAGSLEIVEYIVTSTSIDLNVTDNDNETALHWAAFKGYNNIVQYLIKKGADAKVKSHDNILAGEWFDISVKDTTQEKVRHTLGFKQKQNNHLDDNSNYSPPPAQRPKCHHRPSLKASVAPKTKSLLNPAILEAPDGSGRHMFI